MAADARSAQYIMTKTGSGTSTLIAAVKNINEIRGKSEEQLTSTDCRSTDNQQFTRRIADSRLEKKYLTEPLTKPLGKQKQQSFFQKLTESVERLSSVNGTGV